MNRSKESYNVLLEHFLPFGVLVECPSCQKKAIVTCPQDHQENEENVRFSCLNCGKSRLLTEKPKDQIKFSNGKIMDVRFTQLGGSIDPFFGYKLWLIAHFEGNELWAYNHEHLTYLENHVGATLRERNGVDNLNRSLGSRLPTWMTSAKNRTRVLKVIEQLKLK